MSPDDARQLFDEVQAIPDRTLVTVYAFANLSATERTEFTVTGELLTDGSGRYVGDTPVMVRVGETWRLGRGVVAVRGVQVCTDGRTPNPHGAVGGRYDAEVTA